MALEPVDYTSSDSYSNYSTDNGESVFGGEDDLWGADEITVAQINDPNFKISFDANVGAGLLRVDEVKVEVFYTISAAASQHEQTHDLHAVDTAYTDGDIVWAIADDGVAHKYLAVGTGNSASTSPSFSAIPGSTTEDGDIVWTETGQYQPYSFPPYSGSTLCSGSIGRNSSGERIFIVVGQKGTIKTSLDGDTWEEQESGVAETLRGVAASKDGFIAVGDNGTILTSSDGGVTWVQEDSGTQEPFFSVDFDRKNNSFTAVGKDGLIRQKVDAGWNIIQR